jgi:hypothetical protein
MTADRTPTPEQRAEWQRLADAATPGPWNAYTATCCPDQGGVAGTNRHVCPQHVGAYGHPMDIEDAAFIAAAREAVPALLSSLAAAEERARAAIEARDVYRAKYEQADAERRGIAATASYPVYEARCLRGKAEAENAALRSERDALAARVGRLDAVLLRLIDEGAVEHEDGCPEDDTCDCPFVAQVNAALAASPSPTSGSAPVAPAREPECPGARCPMCSGEACRPCGPGLGNDVILGKRPPCEHDIIERHCAPRPETPAPALAATPLADPKRWHLCRHDILRRDCAECRAPVAPEGRETDEQNTHIACVPGDACAECEAEPPETPAPSGEPPEHCRNFSPPWFEGRWRDWHRGHGCDMDDGRPRTPQGQAEIEAGLRAAAPAKEDER